MMAIMKSQFPPQCEIEITLPVLTDVIVLEEDSLIFGDTLPCEPPILLQDQEARDFFKSFYISDTKVA